MRDDAFSRVGKDGPDYFIDGVKNNVNSHIYRFKNACYNVFIQTKSPRDHYAGAYLELCLCPYTSMTFCLALTW